MDISEICLECKNYFLKDRENSIYAGTYTIENGLIYPTPNFLKVGQYFKINSSDLNDGVYKYTGEAITTLQDEIFDGSIWAMSVPPAFLQMCKEIDEWRTKFEDVNSGNMSPWSSESVTGVYSRAKATTGTSEDGSVMTWKSVFKARLAKWRRISIL